MQKKIVNINILTGVNPVNFEYFFYFIDNIRKLASGKHNINVSVLTGQGRGSRNVCSQDQIEKIKTTGVEVVNGNHLFNLGESLNYLLSIDNQKTNDVTLISDIDVAIVRKNWDEYALEYLKKYDVIGLPNNEPTHIFEGSKTPDNAHRYHNNPTVVWMMFNNSNIWKTIDFRPDKDNEIKVKEQDAILHGIPNESYLAKDIGWRIPEFISNNNLKSYSFINAGLGRIHQSIIFDGITNNISWGDGKSGFPCDEGRIDGLPFIAHQRLSQRWEFMKSPVSKLFYERVTDYINSHV